MTSQYLQYEKNLLNKGYKYIAGIDEVGRGALAGPMVVGSIILNPEHLLEIINNDILTQELLETYLEIRDSKKLAQKKRERISDFLLKNALAYHIEALDNSKIDQWGISKSTQVCFFNCTSKLLKKPQYILTDSFPIRAYPESQQTNIISGDSNSVTIAAASIIAKVYRDNLMSQFSESNQYKNYLFHKNKGYGTKEHINALNEYGPSDIHRLTYEPLRSMLLLHKSANS